MDQHGKIMALTGCLFWAFALWGQYESSADTATGSAGLSTTYLHDYQALGINPANIGTGEAYHIAFGFMEGGFSLHSQALSRSKLSNILTTDEAVAIPAGLKRKLSKSFVNEGFSVDMNFMAAGLAVQVFERVAFALKVDLVSNFRTRFNQFASNFFYEGYHYDSYFDQLMVGGEQDTIGVSSQPKQLYELVQGSYLKSSFTIPITIGSGFRVMSREDFTLHAGIGIKYVLGITMLNFRAESGVIKGRGSYNSRLPLGIKLMEGSVTTSNGWTPAGSGTGMDLGFYFQYKKYLSIGGAVTDMGEVTWVGNTFSINNTLLDSTGYHGADNLKTGALYEKISHEEKFINKNTGSFSVSLPAKLRLGAKFAPVDFLDVGMDVIIPLNNAPGNYVGSYIGAGANVKLFNILKFSLGANYVPDYGFGFPMGLVFRSIGPKNFEAGLASRDFMSFFMQENPNISYNFGLLRFKF